MRQRQRRIKQRLRWSAIRTRSSSAFSDIGTVAAAISSAPAGAHSGRNPTARATKNCRAVRSCSVMYKHSACSDCPGSARHGASLMKFVSAAIAALVVCASPAVVHAAEAASFAKDGKSLCMVNEKVVTSFRVDLTMKTASICEERLGSYVVYRYGTRRRVELQYPSKLNAESWELFELQISHPDREALLAFRNNDQGYGIHQTWNREGEVDSVLLVDRADGIPLMWQGASTEGRLDWMEADFTESRPSMARSYAAVAEAEAAAEAAAAEAEAVLAAIEEDAAALPGDGDSVDHDSAKCGCEVDRYADRAAEEAAKAADVAAW